jgi:hypothetical protein
LQQQKKYLLPYACKSEQEPTEPSLQQDRQINGQGVKLTTIKKYFQQKGWAVSTELPA